MAWFKKKKSEKIQHRSYAAAQKSNLTQSWIKEPVDLSVDLHQQLDTLRARSREQAQNNPYVLRFLHLCQSHIIGAQGMHVQVQVKNASGEPEQQTNNKIEERFQQWGNSRACDARGQLTWLAMQRLIVESVARDGEVLIRFMDGADNPFGFSLELINIDRLDTQFNAILTSGNRVCLGVELDTKNQVIAYHLKPEQHRDIPALNTQARERIDARHMLHLFERHHVDQLRGVPWLHAVLLPLHMLNGYIEAELVAARVAASKMGFFERNAAGEGYKGDGANDGECISKAEPGTFEQLPHGVSFKAFDPNHPAGNFDAFIKASLRSIASGLSVSYNMLANDLEGVNFSSLRAGVLEERESWMLRQSWFIEMCATPVFLRWLKSSLIHGALPFPAQDYERLAQPTWQGRRWPWVDPLKDLKAIELELSLGLTNIEEVIRRLGRDPDALKNRESNNDETAIST